MAGWLGHAVNNNRVQQITVLGATGSIGSSTLDVIERHPERYQVYALTAHQQVEKLANELFNRVFATYNNAV